MAFVGIVSDNKKFEIIKKLFDKNKNKKNITLININNKSIENLKKIRFEVVVIVELPKRNEDNKNNLEQICKDVKFIIINSDLECEKNFLKEIKSNIITFGLNHLSTVTFSSVTDENILISVQRNYNDFEDKAIEVGEYNVPIIKNNRNYIYEVLAYFIINSIIKNY